MNPRNKLRTPLLFAALLGAASALSAPVAGASEVGYVRKFGLGGMIGAPTGLSMKLYFNERHALDFGVGIGFLNGNAGSVHVDYLFHFMLSRNTRFDLPLYVGIGGQVKAFWDDGYHSYYGGYGSDGRIGIAVRGPVGIAFNLNRVPIDIFIEVVPGIGFVPGYDSRKGDAHFGETVIGPGFYLESAAGCRYYF